MIYVLITTSAQVKNTHEILYESSIQKIYLKVHVYDEKCVCELYQNINEKFMYTWTTKKRC